MAYAIHSAETTSASTFPDQATPLEQFDWCEAQLAVRPTDVLLWQQRSYCLAQLKRYPEAVTSYQKTLTLVLDDPKVWCNYGSALAAVGNLQDAVKAYDRALDLAPDYAKVWRRRGQVLYHLGEYGRAIESYDQALALAPTESRLWYVKGLATYQLGQLDQAIKYFRIAIEQESTAPAPHLALIYLLMTTHQGDNLQAYIESLLAQGWDQADLHDYYACLMQRQGHLQVAHDHLQRAIQVDPRPASRWLRLGIVLAQLRDYTAAHDALREALKRRADDANGWLALGMVLRQLSANEAAIDAFNKALALTPNHPLAFFHQACCYGALQRPDWAIEHLRRAIALDPARYLPRSQREPVLQGLEARSLMAS